MISRRQLHENAVGNPLMKFVRQLRKDMDYLLHHAIVSPEQLSDLCEDLGYIQAGAFICGTGSLEDGDFTGNMMVYPPYEDAVGDLFTIFGMNAGVLQVGWNSADGKIYAGGKAVIIDQNGILGSYGGALTFWLQSDGDVFIGSNVGAPATTSFSVFSNAQTYNGENMGAGDVLLGCNAAGYANVLWDVSDKQLKFRGGVTTRLYIGTDGSLYWSAGWLNNDGISILYSDTPGDANKIKFTGLLSDAYIYADGAGTICLVSGDGGRGGQHINIAGGDLRIASSANSSFFQMGTGVYIYAGSAMDGQETVFNENGRDINFRIEGDTDANLFRLDAGLDAIGIGGAPTAGQKLKVTGAMTVTGALTPGSIAGWAIGSNVQAWDAQLDQLALCAVAADGDFIVGNYGDGSSPTWEKKTAAEARTALGLAHGTYTPTLTNVTNIADSGATVCQYMRIGNTVTVSGRLTADPTTTGACEIGITLPVASDFAGTTQCCGTGFANVGNYGTAIIADITNNRASMQWVAVDVANRNIAFSFTYLVV